MQILIPTFVIFFTLLTTVSATYGAYSLGKLAGSHLYPNVAYAFNEEAKAYKSLIELRGEVQNN